MPQVFRNTDGVMIGFTMDDTYFTQRKSKEHFYRKGQGYPISESILQTLAKTGIAKVKIIETRVDGTKHHYESRVSDWQTVPVFQEKDFDAQRCLPLKRMTKL